jgi:hypothetical protein
MSAGRLLSDSTGTPPASSSLIINAVPERGIPVTTVSEVLVCVTVAGPRAPDTDIIDDASTPSVSSEDAQRDCLPAGVSGAGCQLIGTWPRTMRYHYARTIKTKHAETVPALTLTA